MIVVPGRTGKFSEIVVQLLQLCVYIERRNISSRADGLAIVNNVKYDRDVINNRVYPVCSRRVI